MRSPPHRCDVCNAELLPDDPMCRECWTAVPDAWRRWLAPGSPLSPNVPSTPFADPAFVPLRLSPGSTLQRRRRFIHTNAVSIVVTLAATVLLVIAELMLRDGRDHRPWATVWYASVSVTALAILWWVAVAVMHWRNGDRPDSRSRAE